MESLTNDHTKTTFGSGKKKRKAADGNSFTFSFRIGDETRELSVELDAEYKRIVEELEYLNRLSRKFKGMHNKLCGIPLFRVSQKTLSHAAQRAISMYTVKLRI